MSLKEELLCFEAKRWQGFTETGGDNRGQVVEMFQKAVGSASGESWCVSFIQYCVKMVDALAAQCRLTSPVIKNSLVSTESVLALWSGSPHAGVAPAPGTIVLWEHYKDGKRTGLGHAGIVLSLAGGRMTTIEGNTSPSNAVVERNGDGVYVKDRPIGDVGNMKLLGFIKAWS